MPEFRCTNCDVRLATDDESIGQEFECPRCRPEGPIVVKPAAKRTAVENGLKGNIHVLDGIVPVQEYNNNNI